MFSHAKLICFAIVCLFTPWANAATNVPLTFTSICTVAPDIISLKIVDGKVHYGQQRPYLAQSNDTQAVWKNYGSKFLQRAGADVGALVGTHNATMMTFDRVEGNSLDPRFLDNPLYYRLRSASDVNFETDTKPIAVFRKSRPIDLGRTGRWRFAPAVEHTLYLQFAHPLKGARPYEISVADASVETVSFRHDPFNTVSEAIHINQLGFHPEDEVKVAFLSIWLGQGGAHSWGRNLPFRLIDNKDERTVFTGLSRLRLAWDENTEDPLERNYTKTDIHELDFSSFKSSGSYRVFIDGIGCSSTIRIASNTWAEAFTLSAQGLYNQRSGTALDSKWTGYSRPRAFHPDEGLQVYHSNCTLMDSGNGLNAMASDHTSFGNINAARTDMIVSNAWGGYFDAGDWSRRIQHLDAARLLLELYETAPDFFNEHALRIPESSNDLPDLIDEALWGLDCFRRMQTPEGGIRGGIESANHPRFGECSWQESLPVMAYAPGAWSSHIYAGVSARAARCLMMLNHASASVYLDSALKAMAFAEKAFQERLTDDAPLPHAAHDARNLAAAELYRVTGAEKWNTLFLSSTAFTNPDAESTKWKVYDQREAAYVYGQTTWHSANPQVARNAQRATMRDAERSLELTRTTGFGWSKDNAWRPVGYGTLSTPQGLAIIRAHAVSGQKRFFDALLMACQTGAGANPLNICYTTGLGNTSPQHPLVIDARIRNQSPPTGITVFGPLDLHLNDHSSAKVIERYVYPELSRWPVMESYFDVYMLPAMCEFRLHSSIARNLFAWGYIAAKRSDAKKQTD